MVNIFSLIAQKKAAFKDYSRKRKTEQLKVLQEKSKEAIEESKLNNQIKAEKEKILNAKGGGIMKKIMDSTETVRLRQMEKGANPTSPFLSDNRISLNGSTRNIHEGVGRNIWEEDKPKKRIFE